MRPVRWGAITPALILAFTFPLPARAQTTVGLQEVVDRARERAPRVVAARLAVEEARARLLGAGLRFQNNPELDFDLASRSGDAGRNGDFGLGISQMWEPPGRRGARVDSATAAIERADALARQVIREVVRDAALAFLRAAHATERLRFLTTAESIASETLGATDRRHKAGEIAVLDVNLARAALARVRADLHTASADREVALGELQVLLGLSGSLDVRPGLPAERTVNRSALAQAAMLRPELQELEAGIREAEADSRLARTMARPEFSVGAIYRREEGDQILGGSLRLTLPAFSRGQELFATGTARASRLRGELEAAKASIAIDLERRATALERRTEALRVLETEALPALDESDSLTTRSFEVGQMGLIDLLIVRRELLDTRFRHLDALLGVAIARIELDFAAGVLR